MVAIGSRRALLNAVASTTLALSDDSGGLSPLSIIYNYSPPSFLLAVAATGRCLYRGEGSLQQPFQALTPQPDLLLPDTYDDPDALAYFQCLEKRLKKTKTTALPSTGHIATSDKAEAAQWGEAVSVWPLGSSFSYVWPKQRKVFFPSDGSCQEEELAINQEVELALTLGHEVLFSTTALDKSMPLLPAGTKSAFLVVSEEYEKELLDAIIHRGATAGNAGN